MASPAKPVPAPRQRRVRLLWVTIGTLFATGCANPGTPKPPTLRLPSPATGLIAERRGPAVILNWQTPANTTDKQANRLPMTAVVCREILPSSAHPAACTEVARRNVTPGPATVTDALPPSLLAEPARLLAYRVELFNTAGRSAKPSAPVFAAAGAAPPPAGAIRVSAQRAGAAIAWTPAPGPGLMELHRTLVPSQSPAVKSMNKPVAAGSSAGPMLLRPEGFAQTTQNPHAADPGGMIDPSIHPGDTATYIAQRVRLITLEGHALELLGEPSAPVTFTDRDTFPPRPPTGLSSIASPPLGQSPAAIDLSWSPSQEPDLDGYNLYRQDTPGGPFRRLNQELLPGPAYRDQAVQPGAGYTYRVTAVDQTRNESPPSQEIHDTLPR